MSDIVERLRNGDTTRRIGESYADVHDRRQADRNEAADEITRLRAEVEDLGNRLHHVHRLWANNEHALRAEVEKLKAALRWYGDTGNWESSWDHQFRMMTQEPAYADRGDKARAALEEKHD